MARTTREISQSTLKKRINPPTTNKLKKPEIIPKEEQHRHGKDPTEDHLVLADEKSGCQQEEWEQTYNKKNACP